MAAYFLALIEEINDQTRYQEYSEKAAPIVIGYGGEYVLKSTDLTPSGGTWNAVKIVLIRFPDRQAISACFQSPEYRQIAPLRENSTRSRSLIIED